MLLPPTASYKETMATFNMAPRSESSYVRGRIRGDRIVGHVISALMGAALGLTLWTWVSVSVWLVWLFVAK